MKIFVAKENHSIEKRVSITPQSMCGLSCEFLVEEDAGILAGFSNESYRDVAQVGSLELIRDADLVVSINPLDSSVLENIKHGASYIVVHDYLENRDHLKVLCSKGANYHALNLIPRTTKAQYMDVLSSQATLAGYRAVIDSFYYSSKVSAMLTTAAGTVKPANVLVVGAGVAGLSAIATAKRLGSIVYALDSRSSAKEQIESLGGIFVEVDSSASTDSVYATTMGKDYEAKQRAAILNIINKIDVIITTAQIPFKKAPIIITKEMLDKAKEGCVVLDLASRTGGNCELTSHNEIIAYNDKKIVSSADVINNVAHDASILLSNNIKNWLKLYEQNKDDDIISQTLLLSGGDILRHEFFS